MNDVYLPGTHDIYGIGYKIVEIPLLGKLTRPTFYRQYGDCFGWGCVGLSGAVILWQLARERRRAVIPQYETVS